MQELIPPVNRDVLLKELTHERFVRFSNNGHNSLYIVNIHNAPNVLQEIGRVREITFRAAGGGTGKPLDLDEFDEGEKCYQQLIVWHPEDKEIVGGYRFIRCGNAALDENGIPLLSTREVFEFSKKFVDEYLPFTIELGRSFVQPQYQPSAENRKGLFSLDNLWDGLGAIVVDNKDIRYFYGKVTMYTHYNRIARDMILSFMNYFFPDIEKLVIANHPIKIESDITAFMNEIKGLSYKDAHHVLNHHVRALGENIPPLVNSYMNLSPTMKTFGTALNHHFGDVEETGIMVTINDIYESKKERHVATYTPKSKQILF